ncbi:MAG: septum formation initiator family protein [Lachnospiraceae bacterium]|nr:septum formation initiator family protein [Lachnospiraceae bacterium]
MVKRKIVFRRKKKENRLSMIMVTMVVLMVLIVVSVKSVELQKKQETYAARIEQLQQQVDEENQRAIEIEEYGKYTKTKKYVEEVAKDKLGLVYEDEIIFKSED